MDIIIIIIINGQVWLTSAPDAGRWLVVVEGPLGGDSAGINNDAVSATRADDCSSLLQTPAARQPHCHAVRADPAQSPNRSQQLRTVHECAARSAELQVSNTFHRRRLTPVRYL